MDIQTILIIVAIGAVAGWLAGVIMSGSGFGLLGDIVIGIIGAVIGGFLFGLLGLEAVDLTGQIISATAGAVVLIYIIRLLKKA